MLFCRLVQTAKRFAVQEFRRDLRCYAVVMPRGYFITFEGLDGSGKTTQLRRLATRLEAEGHRVVTLRQPGGTALGDRIRSILLDSRSEATLGPIAPLAEMSLMFADRAQSIHEIILPALDSGAIVLCDRYTDSSEAYQGAGRQLGSERILAMHRAVCDNLQPDLTLLLLPSLDASLRRARGRNQRRLQQKEPDENRFEREDDDFYRRIYRAYEAIAEREPRRVVPLREDASIEAIEARIHEIVSARIPAPVI
jgi:dTMP kinase